MTSTTKSVSKSLKWPTVWEIHPKRSPRDTPVWLFATVARMPYQTKLGNFRGLWPIRSPRLRGEVLGSRSPLSNSSFLVDLHFIQNPHKDKIEGRRANSKIRVPTKKKQGKEAKNGRIKADGCGRLRRRPSIWLHHWATGRAHVMWKHSRTRSRMP